MNDIKPRRLLEIEQAIKSLEVHRINTPKRDFFRSPVHGLIDFQIKVLRCYKTYYKQCHYRIRDEKKLNRVIWEAMETIRQTIEYIEGQRETIKYV